MRHFLASVQHLGHLVILTWIAGSLLYGCGGGGGDNTSSNDIPVITSHPASVQLYATQRAAFSVSATGSENLRYQWLKNNAPIAGATQSTYTTTARMEDNGALISVQVQGGGGTSTSASALLTVRDGAPQITIQPSPQRGDDGESITFKVTASALLPLSYQWSKNGTAIVGATNSSYTLPTAALAASGSSYSVTVSTGTQSVTSTAAALTVYPVLQELVISEVSSCSPGIDCWFEIYNPTSTPVQLSNYSLRSTSINADTFLTSNGSFTLPSASIPAHGYIVVSGNYHNSSQRGSQNIRLRTGSTIPYWNGSGFIELLKGGATVDFVRFGSSVQTPTTPSKWTGASATALPTGSQNYGLSMVRPYPITPSSVRNQASDWIQVRWVTPAGRNDVPANAVDDDNDGIPDSAEVSGGTFAGMDLYAMGVRTGRRDVLIEVDSMSSTDPGVNPRRESLQKVVDRFALHNIHVAFDAGTLFNAGFSTADFNLGQGDSKVPFQSCTKFDQTTCINNPTTLRSLYDWKQASMDLRRLPIFHYLLFAYSQMPDGSADSSGLGELNGNDLMLTMGNWGLTTSPSWQLNRLINMQASVVMHELGHNLGLGHGGFESTNNKPNYLSIMNYTYGLYGLDPNPRASSAYMRWRFDNDNKVYYCDFVASPCKDPAQFIIDYSDGSSADLDENQLLEANNLGRGSDLGAYADWNLSGTLTSSALSIDLNGDGNKTTLSDYNDWANLSLPFARSADVLLGKSRTLSVAPPPLHPTVDDLQTVAQEPSVPRERMFKLRNQALRAAP